MDFETAYNLNFTGDIELDYKKLQYVPWSRYDIFMIKYFPQMRFEYDLVDLRKKGVAGLGLNCYLTNTETGAITSPMYFPVMDNKKGADESIDCRSLNDNIQRAYAKCIARATGFTLRLWTREGMDHHKKGDNSHPVFRGLVAIHDICEMNGTTSDANFGWSVEKLRTEYKQLTSTVNLDTPVTTTLELKE